MTISMNLPLFVTQLTNIVQSANAETQTMLYDVCELMRSHVSCSVKILDNAGQVLLELLPLESASEGSEHQLQKEIIAGDTALASMQIFRVGDSFSKDENLAFGVAISICTVLLRLHDNQRATDGKRRRAAVRSLINTLSFSELEAAVQIVKELDEDKKEGLLIAGHIADRLGFARSVVTAALKKLEGASLIETRSLGMKGTFIRVKDLLLLEELKKL